MASLGQQVAAKTITGEKTVLILARYSRLGASSRLRLMQYIPHLVAAGLKVEVCSLVNDNYLHALYAGRRGTVSLLAGFVRRALRLVASKKPDVLWIEKEALPWMPWGLEHSLYPSQVPIISDYDDAVFHRYDLHKNRRVRHHLGRKIDCVMGNSQLVLAGNEYLASRARAAGAVETIVIPTVVDTDAYSNSQPKSGDSTPCIGWVGTPETWAAFGTPLLSVLERVVNEFGASFRAVGAGAPSRQVPGFEFLDWSEQNEVQLIQGMDIGIMPLPDTPWARGKCGYKLIQYMACGLPVVASPVGVNSEIVEHGVNGFLANSDEEWRQALAYLISNPGRRREMGAAARLKVERSYSLRTYGPIVAALISQTAGFRAQHSRH